MKEGNVICFGEVLWDNLKEGRRIGGAPLNVCYHLNKMGIKSMIISQVGADEDGKSLMEGLKGLNIDLSHCAVSSTKRTSVVEVHLGAGGDVSYEIVENVAWDYIDCLPETEAIVSNSAVFVFGSLAARHEVSRHTLLRLLRMSSYNVFDVNLRRPFYSKGLIFSLLEHTHLLKLNDEELDIICGWLGITVAEDDKRLSELNSHFQNLEEIILTKGSQGAGYLNDDGYLTVPAFPVSVKDTVGAGDAFLAGFLAGRLKGMPIAGRMQQAGRLASFVAAHQGACPEYDVKTAVGF